MVCYWSLKNGLINPIKKHKRHTPLDSPLNGGINSTIPLRGGVPFCGGEAAFISFSNGEHRNYLGKIAAI
jgi:hypothetical protein